MSRTRFLLIPLAAVIILGLLIVGSWAIHRIGWSEGYAVGQLAAEGVEGATAPYAPLGLSRLGLFLTVGLVFFLVLGVMATCFRFWAWRTVSGPWMMHGGLRRIAVGPNGEPWARYWHGHHHPMPPCCWGWERPPEEAKNGQAGQDVKTGTAARES